MSQIAMLLNWIDSSIWSDTEKQISSDDKWCVFCDCPKCLHKAAALELNFEEAEIRAEPVYVLYTRINRTKQPPHLLWYRAVLAWEAVAGSADRLRPRRGARVSESYEKALRRLKRLQKLKGDFPPAEDVHAIMSDENVPGTRGLDDAYRELEGRSCLAPHVEGDLDEASERTDISFWINLLERALGGRKGQRRSPTADIAKAVSEILREDYLWLTGRTKPRWTNDECLRGDFIDFQRNVWKSAANISPSEAMLRGRT